MNALIHPTYLPNIAHFVAIANSSKVVFEAEDNFQKQTYRNRACIYGANGMLTLNVPVHHTQKERQKYMEVRIANDENWQDQHWKSIQSAYSTSPFFEHYEDELRPLYSENKDLLFQYNLECIQVISECLELDFEYDFTAEFSKDVSEFKDYRYLVNAKQALLVSFDQYIQVFSNKHGFLPNLSILDLLFNEGPNAINYLQSQSL
ncbi:MAG: WbqC family protein [Bacteroidia bacterium]|nr:WbqC family protein [Bacteroidia bacterium]NND10000.1 hypothetical protein [Flavobacteriaceae bacterium]MBT8310864.1 WbqC family protein [Bacteroidia bacterium]NNK28102.1 hypothetical protein [Flavobacteriaceae bacterium]NNL61731.1 hypothetical protein [Flavobacteriaceae bacterium]